MKPRRKASPPDQADSAWLVAEIGKVKAKEKKESALCHALENPEAVRCGKALMKLGSAEGSALPSGIVPPQL